MLKLWRKITLNGVVRHVVIHLLPKKALSKYRNTKQTGASIMKTEKHQPDMEKIMRASEIYKTQSYNNWILRTFVLEKIGLQKHST